MTPWTPERTVQLVALHRQGLTQAVIAKHLGIGRNAVIGKLKRLYAADEEKQKERGRPRNNHKRKIKAYRPDKIERGSWDSRVFEPYAVRKVRLAMERGANNAVR